MIIPLRQKYRTVYVHPKRAGKSDHGTRTRAHQKGGEPEKFFCPCRGKIKMVMRFRNGRLHHLAVCQKCGNECRKPSDF